MKGKTVMKELTIALMLILSVVLITGCTEKEDGEGTVGGIVTLVPQIEMAEAIGGDLVKVSVMVPVGESPHSFAPTPSQMKDVAEAEVYFKVGSGVEFETNHLSALHEANEDMEIVDCSHGITLLKIGGEHDHEDDHHEDDHHEDDDHEDDDHEDDDHEDDHYEDDDHHHEGDDPHIWLSPTNAKQMVKNMCAGLVKVDPDNKETYETNRDAYLVRLDTLISDIETKLHPHENEEFLVYHPAWGYFAHEFELHMLAIQDEGKAPGPAGVAAIVDQAKDHNITVVFVSPQYDTSSAETIADEIGGEVVSVDPLAQNYIDNLRDVATKMEAGLT